MRFVMCRYVIILVGILSRHYADLVIVNTFLIYTEGCGLKYVEYDSHTHRHTHMAIYTYLHIYTV